MQFVFKILTESLHGKEITDNLTEPNPPLYKGV